MTDPHKSGERASVILDSHSHVSRAGSFDSIFLLSAPAAAMVGCSYGSESATCTHTLYHNKIQRLLALTLPKPKKADTLTGSKNSRLRKC